MPGETPLRPASLLVLVTLVEHGIDTGSGYGTEFWNFKIYVCDLLMWMWKVNTVEVKVISSNQLPFMLSA